MVISHLNRNTVRIIQLTNDNREIQKKYDLQEPLIGMAPEALLEGFKQLGGEVEVHVVSCLQHLPRRSPHRLGENIFYHPLHVPKFGWMRTGYQGCIRAVRRKLHELQPDVVHGQGTERDCGMTAVFSGFPNVLTIHGNMGAIAGFLKSRPLTYYWIAARLERLCLRLSDGIVAISNYTQANISGYARRSWLVPNAVHPSYFGIIRRPSDSRVILCAATIGEWKNQIGLIEALEPLHREFDFELRFAGGGQPNDPYFIRFQNKLATAPWCTYLGALEREELQQELASTSIAVLPSLEDNCPMVILEASAAGVAFAASRIGGIPDLIQNNKNGVLFDPRDAHDMRDKVRALLLDSGLAGKLGKTAQQDALERFSPNVVARRHLCIYREVVEGRR
jgi:glycosyltransferase involved in cell wall biosynthesis